MRIIGGSLRGRKLIPPEGMSTRPTSDRLRESLFNILAHKLEGGFKDLRVADIFAGTGALGIEALSRGATHITFVEKHGGPETALYKNIKALGLEKNTKTLSVSARQLPEVSQGFNLIFMDPPYSKGLADIALKSILYSNWCLEGCHIVVESHIGDKIEIPSEFEPLDSRLFGKTKIQILGFSASAK